MESANVVDKLSELEKVILEHYLCNGYKLAKDQEDNDPKWGFKVRIVSTHKDKSLMVEFSENNQITIPYSKIGNKTTDEMYNEALRHFKNKKDIKWTVKKHMIP